MCDSNGWLAGAAEVDITPAGHPYLAGYPYVSRLAEGVYDPLLTSSLYLSDGVREAVFVACDLLNLPGELASHARRRIEETTGVPAGHVMVTATHTHSGPIAVHMLTNDADPLTPRPDAGYLAQVEDRIVEAAIAARSRREPVRLFSAQADGSQLGANRRDPAGPRIPQVPLLLARRADGSEDAIAVMAVCAMHPTVLHEDWLQVSGDFPGLARRWLKQNVTGPGCPFVYHMGAAGNQSPRHVVRGNTIEEAHRLGETLGRAIQQAITEARPIIGAELRCSNIRVDLPMRRPPTATEAEARAAEAEQAWRQLQRDGAARAKVRTAECDWFGAKKLLALARAAEGGRLHEAAQRRMPAEVQTIAVGEHVFVGWPGEVFAEFAIEVMRSHPRTTIITLANGELHGYLVTREAVLAGGYEASHALFESPASGDLLVQATRRLLDDAHAST